MCSCLSDRVTYQSQRRAAAFVVMLDDVPQRANTTSASCHETSELPAVLFTSMISLLHVKTDLPSPGIVLYGRTQHP